MIRFLNLLLRADLQRKLTWEEIKKKGTDMYRNSNYEEAAKLYGEALKSLEGEKGTGK